MVTAPLRQPGLFRNPHPLLHELRVSDPVHWSEELSGWLLLSYDDVSKALHDERLASTAMVRRIERLPASSRDSVQELRRSLEQWMGLPNPDDHRRYGRLLRPYFSERHLRALEPQVRRLAVQHLSELVRRGGGDIVHDFAQPFSVDVISHVLGLPVDVRGDLIRWSNEISAVFHVSELAELQAAQRAAEEAAEYLRGVISVRQKAPGDDLISLFLEGLRTGSIHDEQEIIANLIMMIAVGFKTTSHVLSTGTYLLLEHEDQRRLLIENRALIPAAIEEIVRYDGPVFITTRVAQQNLFLREHQVQSGDAVLLALAAANRDPAMFANPDEFKIQRGGNRHLGFGGGLHFCLGAQLARLEVEIAIDEMLSRMPRLRLAQEPEWYEFPPLARWLSRLTVSC